MSQPDKATQFNLDLLRDGDVKSFTVAYVARLVAVLEALDLEGLQAFAQAVIDRREQGNRILFLGNGGSSSTANHVANDLAIGTRSRGAYRASSISANMPVLTAIANDYGYDDVFAKQLDAEARRGDLVVAISVSGNSPNVLAAVRRAKEIGCLTVGLSGSDGGALRDLVDISVHLPSDPGAYGPIEDAHLIVNHILAGYLMAREWSDPTRTSA